MAARGGYDLQPVSGDPFAAAPAEFEQGLMGDDLQTRPIVPMLRRDLPDYTQPMAPGGFPYPFHGWPRVREVSVASNDGGAQYAVQPSAGDPWGAQAQGAEIPITSGPSSARIGWALGQEARGIASSAWDAFTAPRRAYSGQIAPGDMLGEGLNMAGWVTAPGLGRAAW